MSLQPPRTTKPRQPGVADEKISRQDLDLYPYLSERRRDLAPALAQTLRDMQREGLFERYRAELAGKP